MSHCKPLVILVAALANLGIAAFASASDRPQDIRPGLGGFALPLAAPLASTPVSQPGARHAFPADVLERMRAVLVVQSQAPRPRVND